MNILRKFFGPKHTAAPPEHAVIVQFDYGSMDFEPVFAISTRLEQAIGAAQAGEFDGNELATDGSEGSLYMYGPDADRLFAAVRPVLDSVGFMRGARIRLRYGPARSGAREQLIVLGT